MFRCNGEFSRALHLIANKQSEYKYTDLYFQQEVALYGHESDNTEQNARAVCIRKLLQCKLLHVMKIASEK